MFTIICSFCNKQFTKDSLSKFCSPKCYHNFTIGKPSKKRNGKIINCKKCNKEIYVPKSHLSDRKFCSKECSFSFNKSLNGKPKKCVICGKSFLTTLYRTTQQKTCSVECRKKNNFLVAQKGYKAKSGSMVCSICKKTCTRRLDRKNTGLCDECLFSKMSKERENEGNPAYLSGIYSKNGIYKNSKWGVSSISMKHLQACAKYRKDFLDKNTFLFCEVCNKSNQLRYEVHHIYFASRFPYHINLHNFKNLILICQNCHIKFHNSNEEYQTIFKTLEKERQLKDLFT